MITKNDLTFNLQGLKRRLIIAKIKRVKPNFDKSDLLSSYISRTNEIFPVNSCKTYTKKDWNNFDELDFKLATTVFRDFIQDTFGIAFSIEEDGISNHRNKFNAIIARVVTTERGKTTVLTFEEYAEIIKLDDFTEFIVRYMNPREHLVSKRKKMLDELMFLQNNRYINSPEYQNDKRNGISQVSKILNLLFPEAVDKIKKASLNIDEFDGEYQKQIFSEIVENNIHDFSSNKNIKMEELSDLYVINAFIDAISRWNEKESCDSKRMKE